MMIKLIIIIITNSNKNNDTSNSEECQYVSIYDFLQTSLSQLSSLQPQHHFVIKDLLYNRADPGVVATKRRPWLPSFLRC